MRIARHWVGTLVAVLVFVLGGAAWAQGYTVTNVTGKWVNPPSNATSLGLSSHSTTTITLPFEFPYFGNTHTRAIVGDEGFMQINPTTANGSTSARAFPHSYDGTIAVAWYYHMHANPGQVVSHTSGTAPNRVFYVTWNGVGSPGIYAQIQLHETSGRIIFAYKTGGNWGSANPYYQGIQGVGTDNRYVVPGGVNSGKNTQPSTDYQMDPVVTSFTGRLLTTKVVSDATGIGNSVLTNQPAGGVQLQLRNTSGGGVVGVGATAADGTFSISGLALNSSQSGTLRLSAQGPAAVLRTTAAGNPIALDLAGTISFSGSASLGTITLDDTTDASGAMRRAVNILTAVQRVYEFASEHSPDPIPRLDVLFDPSSTLLTSYSVGTAPSLRIGSTGSSNPDEWDDDVIARAYGLHVFGAVTGVPAAPTSLAYDQSATGTDGLALGFAYALASAVSGDSQQIDGRASNFAELLDIDADEPVAPPSADVPGWVALALHDLVDDDDESHDWVDGTSRVPGSVLRAFDALTEDTMDAQNLYETYVAQGGDAVGTARDFIHHGLLPDDGFEANDTKDEVADLGALPLIRRNLVLNAANEDWYRVSLGAAVSGLNMDVVFDRSTTDTQVEMEVFDAIGNRIGVGTPQNAIDPVRWVSGALPAGDYDIRVAHVGGAILPSYTFQAYESLAITVETLSPWTVSIPYTHSLGVRGGIPGYTLRAPQAATLPPGLVLNDTFGSLGGVPSRAGNYTFIVAVSDSAEPPNQLSRVYVMDVNDRLSLDIEPFTPLAVGKTDGFPFVRSGGTDPLTVTSAAASALPGGLTIAGAAARVDGVPNATGSARVQIDAVDLAGDSVSRTTTVVVCAPITGKNAPVDLAEGDRACGYYVDGVKGSVLVASIKTAKKQPKRSLEFTVLDASGRAVTGGKVTSGKSGAAGVKGLVLPETGRYFLVCSSASGPVTQLVANVKVGAPKKGAGVEADFGDPTVLEVAFGVLEGATFQFTGKPAKGSALAGVRVQAIVAPDGRFLPATSLEVVEKGSSIQVKGTCDQSGTWILRLTAKPGPEGDFAYSIKLAQPKSVTYSAD